MKLKTRVGAEKREYEFHQTKADEKEDEDDYAGAASEWEAAASLLEEMVDDDAEPGSEDERRSQEALWLVLNAREEVCRLRKSAGDQQALLTAEAARDKWIADHWENFDNDTKDHIDIEYHDPDGGLTLDQNGFAARASDALKWSVMLSGLDADARLEAARARSEKVLGYAEKEKTYAEQERKVDEELEDAREKVGEKTDEADGLVSELDALEMEQLELEDNLDEARTRIEGALGRDARDKDMRLAYSEEEAQASVRLEEIEKELSAKREKLRSIRIEIDGLEKTIDQLVKRRAKIREDRVAAHDSKNELLANENEIKSLEEAALDCLGILGDLNDPADGKADEAIALLVSLYQLGSDELNNMILARLHALEENATNIEDVKKRKSVTERLVKLKLALIKSSSDDLFIEEAQEVLRQNQLEHVPDVSIPFADNLSVPSPVLLDAVVDDMKGDSTGHDLLAFLVDVWRANQSNVLGVYAMRHIVDILHDRLKIKDIEKAEDIDIDKLLSDGLVRLLIARGLPEGPLGRILEQIKDDHGEENAWGAKGEQAKNLLIAGSLPSPDPEDGYPLITAVKDRASLMLEPEGLLANAVNSFADAKGDSQSDKFYDAIGFCEDALAVDESNIEARLMLGWLYFEQDRYDKATEAFKKVAEGKDPRKDEALRMLARIQLKERKHPDRAKSFEELATLRLEKEDYEGALESVDRALAINPGDEKLVLLKVKIYKKIGARHHDTTLKMLDGLIADKYTSDEIKKEAYGLRAEYIWIGMTLLKGKRQ